MAGKNETGVRYKDKVTMVTGGSRGLGRAIVETFVNEGERTFRTRGSNTGMLTYEKDTLPVEPDLYKMYGSHPFFLKNKKNDIFMKITFSVRHGSKVAFCDILEQEGLELESSLKSGFSGDAMFVKCDVKKEADIKNFISKTVDTYGRIDCLVNNAGITFPVENLDTLTVDMYREIHEVNLLAPFHVSKIAIPYLRQTKGNIINMCSIVGIIGQNDAMAYISAKVMNRLGTPDEIAMACLFLAADATYSTGVNLVTAGGCDIGYGLKTDIEQMI